MSFYRRYELERLIADGEAKTFRAVETATGRAVWLHIFNPEGQELAATLKAKATGPGGSPLPPLLEIGDFAGSKYAVTEFVEPFPGLRQWIGLLPDAVAAGDAPSGEALPPMPAARAAVPAPSAEGLGSLPPAPTAGAAPSAEALPTLPPARTAAAELSAKALASPPPARTAGTAPSKALAAPPVAQSSVFAPPPLVDDDEFTRLLGSVETPPSTAGVSPPALLDDASGAFVKPPANPAPHPAPRATAPLPPLVHDEEGEFARLFGRDDAFPKSAPPSQQPSLLDDASGEFRRAFPVPPSTAPAIPVAEQMGDFTRAFGPAPPAPSDSLKPRLRVPPPTPRRPGPEALPAAPPNWSAAGDTGEFAKLFGSGLPGEALDIAGEQAKAAQAAPSESRPFQQAGEFTRIFGPAIGNSSPAQPPAPPVPLNTSDSGVFALPVELAKPAAEQPDTPSAPNDYSSVFGQKPASSEPAAPPAIRKPAPDIDLTAPKSRMRPAVIAGVAIGVVVLITLMVLAVMLSRR